MSVSSSHLNRRAAVRRHHEDLPHPVAEAVKDYLPAVERKGWRQRRHVAAGQLLYLSAWKRHAVQLLDAAPVGVEHQPSLIARGIEAFDLLAAGGHRLRPAEAHRTGPGNGERPYIGNPGKR